jgi:hypothetical protein
MPGLDPGIHVRESMPGDLNIRGVVAAALATLRALDPGCSTRRPPNPPPKGRGDE